MNGSVKVHFVKHVNHETEAVLDKFLRDLYVDDTATSSISLADASKFFGLPVYVMNKVVLISESRKSDSNDETVKRSICDDNSKFIKDNVIRKILGIIWNIFHDELEIFDLAELDQPKLDQQLTATKRNILKIIGSELYRYK